MGKMKTTDLSHTKQADSPAQYERSITQLIGMQIICKPAHRSPARGYHWTGGLTPSGTKSAQAKSQCSIATNMMETNGLLPSAKAHEARNKIKHTNIFVRNVTKKATHS